MIINPYVYGGPALDPDAAAFLTAAAITDPTITTAINTLVVDMKGFGIWIKMKAIYPMVGGTATTHKWNLKNPLDTNAAFRLVFNGGWTHSSTGAKPNGLNAIADTFLISSGTLSQNSSHISYYSRTNSNNVEVEIGTASGNSPGDAGSLLEIRTSGISYYRVNSGGTYITYIDADSRAFYVANRTGASVINGWRNSTKVATGITASTGLSTKSLILGAYNAGSIQFYSTKECAFSSIGDGLTDTEAGNFYTAVQAFNTTLARQV
jgi:hypothetical protein